MIFIDNSVESFEMEEIALLPLRGLWLVYWSVADQIIIMAFKKGMFLFYWEMFELVNFAHLKTCAQQKTTLQS